MDQSSEVSRLLTRVRDLAIAEMVFACLSFINGIVVMVFYSWSTGFAFELWSSAFFFAAAGTGLAVGLGRQNPQTSTVTANYVLCIIGALAAAALAGLSLFQAWPKRFYSGGGMSFVGLSAAHIPLAIFAVVQLILYAVSASYANKVNRRNRSVSGHRVSDVQ